RRCRYGPVPEGLVQRPDEQPPEAAGGSRLLLHVGLRLQGLDLQMDWAVPVRPRAQAGPLRGEAGLPDVRGPRAVRRGVHEDDDRRVRALTVRLAMRNCRQTSSMTLGSRRCPGAGTQA